MEHRIKNLHTSTSELHEKATELHTNITELHTKTSELHEKVSEEYATQEYVDDAIKGAIADVQDPVLNGLISKEEDATASYGNANIKLDIITLGDSNTGEIKFGSESKDSSKYGTPRTLNSVITKRYMDDLIQYDKTNWIVEIGHGFEIPGITFGGIVLAPDMYIKK
jgi:hypothetical protein